MDYIFNLKRKILSTILLSFFVLIQSSLLFHVIEHNYAKNTKYINNTTFSEKSHNKDKEHNNQCERCKIFTEISNISIPYIFVASIMFYKFFKKIYFERGFKSNNLFNIYFSQAPPIL